MPFLCKGLVSEPSPEPQQGLPCPEPDNQASCPVALAPGPRAGTRLCHEKSLRWTFPLSGSHPQSLGLQLKWMYFEGLGGLRD